MNNGWLKDERRRTTTRRTAQERSTGQRRRKEERQRERREEQKDTTTWKRKGRRNDTEEQAILLQALCDRGGDDGNDWLSYLQSDPVMMTPLFGGVESCLCLTVNCRPRNQEGDYNADIFRTQPRNRLAVTWE